MFWKPSKPSANRQKWYSWYHQRLYNLVNNVYATLQKSLYGHGMKMFFESMAFLKTFVTTKIVWFTFVGVAWLSVDNLLNFKIFIVVWYKFLKAKILIANFWLEKLGPNFWTQKLCHTTTELFWIKIWTTIMDFLFLIWCLWWGCLLYLCWNLRYWT